MSTIGKRIALAREEKGWNQSELARQLGVKPQSVQAWEAGRNVPRPQKMQQMSRLLGKSVGYLMGDENAVSNAVEVEPCPPITSPWRAIPIVGTAQMGTEGYWYALDSADGYVEIPSRDKDSYALRLKGNSMAPAIKSGWIAVCEPNHRLIPLEYVMIRLLDGESMVKELLRATDEEITVQSVNDAYGRRTIPVEQIETIHYVSAIVPPGKVIV